MRNSLAAADVTPSRALADSATGAGRTDGGGLALGAGAYLLWGLFPAFWPLLAPAGDVEILGHRIAWTFVLMSLVLTVARGWGRLAGLGGRTWAILGAAAALIALNWGLYIVAVTSGRVVEAALGYFVNPLVSVLLAVLVLRERLRRAQWAAIGVVIAAVAVLTVDYGRVPWLALVLAVSFGLYGLIKKTVPLESTASLTAEGLVLGPLAVGYLAFLQLSGTASFLADGTGHALLLVAAGPATAGPLLLFGAAARRVPLATLGVLSYLNPTLQLVWGVAVDHEAMGTARWVGFGLVWLALALFTLDALRAAHRNQTPPAAALSAASAG